MLYVNIIYKLLKYYFVTKKLINILRMCQHYIQFQDLKIHITLKYLWPKQKQHLSVKHNLCNMSLSK